MIFSKQISTLQAQVQDLTGQLTAANGNVEGLNGEKAKLETRIEELEAAQTDAVPKAAHDEAIRLKDEAFSTLKGQFEALEQSVAQKVVEGIASAGVPAAKRDPAAVDKDAKPTAGNGSTPQQRLAAVTRIAGSKKD